MKTTSQSTNVPNNQAAADGAFDGRGVITQNQDKPQAFHIQTGIQAGGFYDRFYAWAQGVTDGWNAFDRSTGLG